MNEEQEVLKRQRISVKTGEIFRVIKRGKMFGVNESVSLKNWEAYLSRLYR